jgi:anti-sigma regulatory factor (Ser/Thr protein kinase)
MLTLLLSLASSMYVLMPPRFSLLIDSARDYTEAAFLFAVGTLVVFGVDAMGRNAELLAAMDQANREMREANEQQKAFLRDVLASVTDGKLRLCDSPADLPRRLTPVAESVPVSLDKFRLLRHAANEAAAARGFAAERCQDLITAVGEAAMNAVVHGGEGRVYAKAQETAQIWIEDQGQGITLENLPQATLKRGHSTAGTLGHGFWLILNTVDRFWLLTGKTGTTVVLEQDRMPLQPDWA